MRKRWQFFTILAVVVLTIYNILPTIFYYSRPLKKPISQKEAASVGKNILKRANSLEDQSLQWVRSYIKLLNVKAKSIAFADSAHIKLSFEKTADASLVKKYLPRAGALIPFAPARLSLAKSPDPKTILLKREIPLHFNPDKANSYFKFSFKRKNSQEPAELYKELVFDRACVIANALAGISENSIKLNLANESKETDIVTSLAHDLVQFSKAAGENSPAAGRFYAGFTQSFSTSKEADIDLFLELLYKKRSELKMQKSSRIGEAGKKAVEQQEDLLVQAEALIKRHKKQFVSGSFPLSYQSLFASLAEKFKSASKAETLTLQLNGSSVLFDSLFIDWGNEKLVLQLHKDIARNKNRPAVKQLIINEVAKLQRKTGETFALGGDGYSVLLNRLDSSSSILALDLKEPAAANLWLLQDLLKNKWQPQNEELKSDNYPVYDYFAYQKLPESQKRLCFVLYSPLVHGKKEGTFFEADNIYLISKGLERIVQKYQKKASSSEARTIAEDFKNLQALLEQHGMYGFSASRTLFSDEFAGDLIFQKSKFYRPLLQATREDFYVPGSKRLAILEMKDFEQRLLTLNKIEETEHEELLKLKDDYNVCQMHAHSRYDAAPVFKNPFVDNCLLSLKKYFRGDQRKILHWGLDLSGGKTVQIELRDNNNQQVKNEADLKQGLNELYSRVNKMGVSDVNIRLSDSHIILDFPGAQNLSASELIKASSMFFHVVDEKFSAANAGLAEFSDRFLQEVWNEAIVTDRKDIESINEIAYRHLYGELSAKNPQPRSEAGKVLLENGFQLAPAGYAAKSDFNTEQRKVAIFRDGSKQGKAAHPLLIVFANYALEGTNLDNVGSSYDPAKGNFLRFDVKSPKMLSGPKNFNPRAMLYRWTSQFAQETIGNTDKAEISNGSGWRMAIILNGSVISAPPLKSAIRDGAVIEGSFTQREVNQLAADLKAGSLSFTPRILSEKNVSPELGKAERMQGILATAAALLAVILAMIGYYRFAGIVASCAVLFNLLIMWAVLQNIQATLSLAGIAGVILTVGMAVDANVLVFERIREEFALCGKLQRSIFTGYRKAFSAILDSNVTTVIAALILLNFDSGPIKGFAITLIIGIVSSVFTALFATRYYFGRWLKKTKKQELKMNNLIKNPKFNLLSKAKYIVAFSLTAIVLGCFVLHFQKNSILGMDFTGGFALNLELKESPGKDYRALVEKALLNKGAKPREIQIRELDKPNSLRLMLGVSMEEKGRPFADLPFQAAAEGSFFEYEKNPRIVWVAQALQKEGLQLESSSLKELHKSWTSISGQMSETMRFNAVIGLLIALAAIIGYITYRFEFKYAFSAVLCLMHDVLISLGTIAILNYFKVPLQIDLNTIAAIMTIVGYSLNDTIIIFDRIREELRLKTGMSLKEVVNYSLNITLSRTLITSLTTFLVLLMLAVFGGVTLFGFAVVMIMGVVYGTLSSIFIAAPVMLFLNRLAEKRSKKKLALES